MPEWLAYYWPTILVRSRKKGKTSCGCDCGHCALHGSCHSK